MKTFKSNRGGFTLIELLVVIAIISLLSSVVLASLRDARDKAVFSKFESELNQIKLAVQLYKDSNNGVYPDMDGSLNTLALQLNSAGYFNSNTIEVPSTVSASIYTGNDPEINGDYMTCGSSDWSGSEFVIWFSDNRSTSNELPMNIPILHYHETDGTVSIYDGINQPAYQYCLEI